MDLICNICQDTIQPFIKRVSATHCGHIFHEHCLLDWIRRSPTCPQCREKVTVEKLHRIYFTFGNEKSVPEITQLPLEEQIHNLQFKILLKDKYINYYTTKSTTLGRQNQYLKQEIWKVETQINVKKNSISELKHLLKKKEKDYEALKHELFNKETELQQYKQFYERQKESPQCKQNIQQNLIHAGTEDSDVDITTIDSDTPAQDCLNKLNSHIKLFEKNSCTSKIMKQIDRKEESENRLSNSTIKTGVRVPNMIRKDMLKNKYVKPELEECPVIKKKAKLF